LCRPSTSIPGAIVFAVKLSEDQWKEYYPDKLNSEEMVAEYLATPSSKDGCYQINDICCTLEEVPNIFQFFKSGFTI